MRRPGQNDRADKTPRPLEGRDQCLRLGAKGKDIIFCAPYYQKCGLVVVYPRCRLALSRVSHR